MASVVEREIGMHLVVGVGRTLPVSALLSYSSRSPYQVRVTFSERGSSIATWVFCRGLLLDGLRRPAGQGDVRVWPGRGDRDVVCLALTSPDGSSLLLASAAEVADWNELMCRTVPPGTESAHIDMDRELADLLSGRSGTASEEPR